MNCLRLGISLSSAAIRLHPKIELQDAPVDVCNFFHGELGGFGIFNEQGVTLKTYQALNAFQSLVETPQRVETHGAAAGKLAIVADLSLDEREATMLLSNFSDDRTNIELMWKGFSWTGGVTAEIRTVDAASDFSDVRMEVVDGEKGLMRFKLQAPAIASEIAGGETGECVFSKNK